VVQDAAVGANLKELGMARKQPRAEVDIRLARGRARPEARFPAAPARTTLPQDYAGALAAIESRIQQECQRVVLCANAALGVPKETASSYEDPNDR
jgi:hypothetical protein